MPRAQMRIGVKILFIAFKLNLKIKDH